MPEPEPLTSHSTKSHPNRVPLYRAGGKGKKKGTCPNQDFYFLFEFAFDILVSFSFSLWPCRDVEPGRAVTSRLKRRCNGIKTLQKFFFDYFPKGSHSVRKTSGSDGTSVFLRPRIQRLVGSKSASGITDPEDLQLVSQRVAVW